MAIYFLSDTHLNAENPAVYDKFITYLNSIRKDADEIYILGDLFDYWIGDDGIDVLGHRRTVDALCELSEAGTHVSIMHGNRDFLIGQKFVDLCNATLIAEPAVINIGQEQILLMHGDSLCTDDVDHQRHRQIVLTPDWQQSILKLSVEDRMQMALDMRSQSEKGKSAKTPELMDVNQQAVEAVMKQYRVLKLIHGHTHRPAVHRFRLSADEAIRYVLGDWGSGFDAVIRIDSKNGAIVLHEATP